MPNALTRLPRALERMKVRLVAAALWKRRGPRAERRLLATLRNFSETEADSAWHLLRAAEAARDPAVKADLFGQVLEEMHHAAEFARLFRVYGGGHFVPLKPERKPLIDPALRGADLWKFFVYCRVGEQVAADRFKNLFEALRSEARLKPLTAVLRAILRDEAEHVHGADALAVGTGVSPGRLAAAALSIKGRRAAEAWLRAGRRVTDLVANVILGGVYYVVGTFGAAAARQKLRGPSPTTASRCGNEKVAVALIASPQEG